MSVLSPLFRVVFAYHQDAIRAINVHVPENPAYLHCKVTKHFTCFFAKNTFHCFHFVEVFEEIRENHLPISNAQYVNRKFS